jgi:hypothetical protein
MAKSTVPGNDLNLEAIMIISLEKRGNVTKKMLQNTERGITTH